MSSLGGASSFALIAFSSFLTLLISHLAVQQYGSPVVQRSSSSTILTGTLSSPISPPAPPLPPPIPPPQPPPPSSPPPPPPPSRQYDLQPPLQQPVQPTFTIESTSSPAINLLTLVSLLLFFGLAGLWLESPSVTRSRRREHRRDGKWRGYRNSTRRHSSSSSSGDSHDDDGCNSPGDEASERIPGSWTNHEKTWKGKVKEGVHEMKKKMGLGEEREAEGYRFGFARGEKEENDTHRCCKECQSQAQSKSKDAGKGKGNQKDVDTEQAWSEQIDIREPEKIGKGSIASSLLPADDMAASTSTTREKEIKTKVTKSVTVENAQDSPSSSTNKVAGDRSATPSSTISGSDAAVKNKGKGKEKVAPLEPIETYAEPPTAMPQGAGSTVEPLSDDVLAELSSKVIEVAGSSKEKESQASASISDDKKVEEQSSKSKGKQEEKQKIVEQVTNTASDAQSVTSIESGKEKGRLKKGIETLSSIAKEVKDGVINEVLKELDGDKEDSAKAKGKERGKAKGESNKGADNVEGDKRKQAENVKASEKGDQEKQDPVSEKAKETVEPTSAASSGSKKKNQIAKATAVEASAEEADTNEKEKVTTTIISEQITKVKDTISTSKPVASVQSDTETTSSQKKKKGQAQTKTKKDDPIVENKEASKDDTPSKGKQKAKEVVETTTASSSQTLDQTTVPKVDLSGSKLTLYQQALLQGLLTTGATPSLYHQTADYLCDLYPSLVKGKSKSVNKDLDVDFTASSKKTNIDVSLPTTTAEDNGGSKDAARRALDLYEFYKDNYMKGDGENKASATDSEEVLRFLISALVEAKRDDSSKLAKTDVLPATVAKSTGSAQSHTPSSSTGYPDVIPLDAVNQSSLVKAGVWVKQQQNEKANQINEAIKSLSADVNKNIQYIKEDVEQVKEGANSKVKTIKSLLKRRGNSDQEEKKKPRKSVRLQDAAGRGEGPRDVARGETEQEARFRRLREMANRLND